MNLNKTFGFLILRDLLNPDEIGEINFEFESKLKNTLRSTTTPGHHKYVSWPNLGPDTPFTGSLLEDNRICIIAKQLLGSEFFGISCNSGSFVNDTQWHPDCEDINLHALKFAFYLQSLNACKLSFINAVDLTSNPLIAIQSALYLF